jgi:nucleotide-binding universal stress UspA family protein
MFKNILLATDGSPHAERAADVAIGLAKSLDGAQVTILHVSSEAPSRGQLLEARLDVKSVLHEAAHRALVQTEEKFVDAAVPYRLEVALGDAAHKIVEVSHRGEMDLIVIGSRGLGTMSAVLLGSVSQRVAHDATCPVMIVK